MVWARFTFCDSCGNEYRLPDTGPQIKECQSCLDDKSSWKMRKDVPLVPISSDKPIEPRVGNCLCGQTFPIPIKRGRPPVRCDDCREAYSNGMIRDRLASKGIDPDLALRKRIDSRPTSTPREPMILAEGEDETQKTAKLIAAKRRVDELEMFLKSRGQHISQHQDNW